MSGERSSAASTSRRRPRRQGRINAPDEMLRRRSMRPLPGCLDTNGMAIRAARLAKGLTQEALGRRLKLSQTAIWQLENDRYWINETTARHLAEVLCSPSLDLQTMTEREIVTMLDRASQEWQRFILGSATPTRDTHTSASDAA